MLTIVTTPNAKIIAVLEDQKILKTADDLGIAVFKFRKEGTWTITATDGTNTKTITVEVTNKKNESIIFFPSEPSSYVLIDTYTTKQTWVAPEDGWFQIEVFGASGNGGDGDCGYLITAFAIVGASGGSGGGGGYACSRVKMRKGDTVLVSPGAVHVASTATISSSLEIYDKLKVTPGSDGTDSSKKEFVSLYAGSGGSGGVASGGNHMNADGKPGKNGITVKLDETTHRYTPDVAGGAAGYEGGNVGGYGGGSTKKYEPKTGGLGSAGFIKIYRGDTNFGD